jgi:hypothetical protein
MIVEEDEKAMKHQNKKARKDSIFFEFCKS